MRETIFALEQGVDPLHCGYVVGGGKNLAKLSLYLGERGPHLLRAIATAREHADPKKESSQCERPDRRSEACRADELLERDHGDVRSPDASARDCSSIAASWRSISRVAARWASS